MPVPKTKAELLHQSEEHYKALMEYIGSFSKEERDSEFPPGTMNRNIRDVLAHLYHWHTLFLEWYRIGMQGDIPDKPAKGYSWKDTKQLNLDIWENYQRHDIEEIIKLLDASHNDVHAIIKQHSGIELFEKKKFKWTGSSSLSTYLRSNTSSHYRWAYNLIKKAKKNPKH